MSFLIGLFSSSFLINLLYKGVKLIFSLGLIYIISTLLSPVLSHFVVMRNTATHFLLNTGMIGPITIQFLFILSATFIYFIIVKSVYRLFF